MGKGGGRVGAGRWQERCGGPSQCVQGPGKAGGTPGPGWAARCSPGGARGPNPAHGGRCGGPLECPEDALSCDEDASPPFTDGSVNNVAFYKNEEGTRFPSCLPGSRFHTALTRQEGWGSSLHTVCGARSRAWLPLSAPGWQPRPLPSARGAEEVPHPPDLAAGPAPRAAQAPPPLPAPFLRDLVLP